MKARAVKVSLRGDGRKQPMTCKAPSPCHSSVVRANPGRPSARPHIHPSACLPARPLARQPLPGMMTKVKVVAFVILTVHVGFVRSRSLVSVVQTLSEVFKVKEVALATFR